MSLQGYDKREGTNASMAGFRHFSKLEPLRVLVFLAQGHLSPPPCLHIFFYTPYFIVQTSGFVDVLVEKPWVELTTHVMAFAKST